MLEILRKHIWLCLPSSCQGYTCVIASHVKTWCLQLLSTLHKKWPSPPIAICIQWPWIAAGQKCFCVHGFCKEIRSKNTPDSLEAVNSKSHFSNTRVHTGALFMIETWNTCFRQDAVASGLFISWKLRDIFIKLVPPLHD